VTGCFLGQGLHDLQDNKLEINILQISCPKNLSHNKTKKPSDFRPTAKPQKTK